MFEGRSSLKEIGTNAFRNCGSLKHIVLPEGFEAIRKNAFECSELEEITLPGTLKEII